MKKSTLITAISAALLLSSQIAFSAESVADNELNQVMGGGDSRPVLMMSEQDMSQVKGKLTLTQEQITFYTLTSIMKSYYNSTSLAINNLRY